MQSIDWRIPAAYKRIKDLPPAGFAWEYLRRNDEYRHDFQIITLTGRLGERQLERFAQRWGLRFPKRPRRIA
mgnify:CR=1 FL=1